MPIYRNLLFYVAWMCCFAACQTPMKPLSYWGPTQVVTDSVTQLVDTIHYQLEMNRFTQQNGKAVTSQDLIGKVTVVEFFFTSCPTICPKMTTALKDVHESIQDDQFRIVSISIDPKHDTEEVLLKYANKLEVDHNRWWFLTGTSANSFATAENCMVHASNNDNAPGGFLHSSNVVLIDQNQHIRGYYDALNPDELVELEKAIEWLLEQE